MEQDKVPNRQILLFIHGFSAVCGVVGLAGIRKMRVLGELADFAILGAMASLIYLSVVFHLVARFPLVLPKWAARVVPRALYADFQSNYLFHVSAGPGRFASVYRLLYAALPMGLGTIGYFNYGWMAGLLGLVLGMIIYALRKRD